jgi:hypothetical protein
MIATNTNWDSRNAAAGKQPIYVMALSGQATVYSTCDLAAAGVTGVLPTCRAWLKTPQGAGQSVDVVNGTSTIGELMCEVIDQAGVLRTLIGTTTLEGATLTLSVGYPGIAYSEFVALQTYQVYKITPSGGYNSWCFQARDKQLLAKKTIAVHPENGGYLSTDNPWYLSGSAPEIVQAVTLFGLGLSPSAIDVNAIHALESPLEGLYSATRPYLFAMTDSFGAKQFLETEIYKSSGLHAMVTNTGAISLRSFRAPAAGAVPVFAFTADNICGLPSIDRLDVINEIIFRMDYDGSNYGTELFFLESNSLANFGRTTQWVMESQGLRTELGGQWYAQWVASRLFKRFAGTVGLRGGAPTAQIEAFLASAPVWVGDYVSLSHPLMPNLLTGALGVTGRVYEVISRDPDYASGRMKFTLLDTGLTGGSAAFQWGGAGVVRPMVIGTSGIY